MSVLEPIVLEAISKIPCRRGSASYESARMQGENAQVYPLRYSEHVFSRRRRDLVAQRAAAQGIFEMASSLSPCWVYSLLPDPV
jgi:hypothetical protein